MSRAVEELDFDPSDPREVVERMERMAAAGDGWVNLLPGVPEDALPEERRSVFTALFGTAQPPAAMCTWMPAARGRRRPAEQTVGIMHPQGRFAVAKLSSMGIELPFAWRVGQDHARRGLIVHPPAASPCGEVLRWTLRAGAALVAVPLTGRWKAQVYLPRQAQPPAGGRATTS